MVVAIDVQCGGTAVVGWRAWTDAAPAWTRVDRHPGAPAPYVDRRRPGRGAAVVGAMEGPFRRPTLLELADSLARTR